MIKKISCSAFGLVSLLFSSQAVSQQALCPKDSPGVTIGGHVIQECQYDGLYQKEINDQKWIGEYGKDAITLFKLSEQPGHFWMIMTAFKGHQIPNSETGTKSVLFYSEGNCSSGYVTIKRRTEFSGFFGNGKILRDIKFNYENGEYAPQVLIVPCNFLNGE